MHHSPIRQQCGGCVSIMISSPLLPPRQDDLARALLHGGQ
jgi:hypothetical protein